MLTIPLGPYGVEKNIVMGKVVFFECLKSLTSLYDPRERENHVLLTFISSIVCSTNKALYKADA